MEPGTRLAALFAEVSHDLAQDSEGPLTFDRVTQRAVTVVPACSGASITLRQRRDRLETVASTDEIARRSDELQYTFREGPCYEAALDHENYFCPDLVNETRWPRWAPAAVEAGARSLIGIRLHTDTDVLGALNLYSSRRQAFDADSLDIALIFAAHASEALSTARVITGLRTALESRHAIGIAQGILAERFDVSVQAAFEVLRRYANNHNAKIRDLARVVVETGNLPEEWQAAAPALDEG